jgi:hypothetical protein
VFLIILKEIKKNKEDAKREDSVGAKSLLQITAIKWRGKTST